VVTIKERTIKGRTYVYVAASTSYKGEKKRFEKLVGPKGLDPKEEEHRKEYLSRIVDLKANYYRTYLSIIRDPLRYLTSKHHFYLGTIAWQYQQFLSDLYPRAREKYEQEHEVRYVHNTTAIEGNTLTLRDTQLVLEHDLAPNGKDLREVHEVENYKQVLKYVRSYEGDFSMDLVLTLHGLIQRNIDDDTAGHFRRINVAISGSTWEPTPFPLVEQELENLIAWYHAHKKDHHPFELAGMVHHRFLQIHPFVDGNGRVARELMNVILRRNGYPTIIIPVKERAEYMTTLEKADSGDLTPLMQYFFKVFLDDYRDVIVEFFREWSKEAESKDGSMDAREVEAFQELVAWFNNLFTDILSIEVEFKLGIAEALESASNAPSS